MQFADELLDKDRPKNCYSGVLNKEHFSTKIRSISVKLKRLWPKNARIIFCLTYILVDDMRDGKTLNCRNLLNIDPNDLIFF